MAIAFDAGKDPGGFSVTNPSFTFTVGSLTNGLLTLGIFLQSGTETITSATWDSGGTNQAMTLVGPFTYNGNANRLYLAYLAGPVNNGTYTLAYTVSAAVVTRPLAATYQGCAQTGIFDNTGTNTATATSLSSAVTSVADNCWHIGFGRESNNGNTSAGANTTKRVGTASVGWFDNNAAITPAGSNTITFTTTASTVMAFYTATIAPFVSAAASSIVVPNLALLGAG